MHGELAGVAAGVRADLTLEGALVRVNALVFAQAAAVCRAVVALFTFIWLLSRVRSHVRLQLILPTETLPARLTLVGFVTSSSTNTCMGPQVTLHVLHSISRLELTAWVVAALLLLGYRGGHFPGATFCGYGDALGRGAFTRQKSLISVFKDKFRSRNGDSLCLGGDRPRCCRSWSHRFRRYKLDSVCSSRGGAGEVAAALLVRHKSIQIIELGLAEATDVDVRCELHQHCGPS